MADDHARDPATTARSQRPNVLGLIALAMLPLLLLAALSSWQTVRGAEARAADERIALANAAALRAGAFVNDNLSTIGSLAQTRALRDPQSFPELQEFLDRVLAVNPDWEGWGLSDQDGWNIVGTGVPPRTVNVADRPYFQQVIATGRPVVSSALLNRRTGDPTIVVAAPVELTSGRRGMVAASLSTARLADELRTIARSESIRILVVDAEGKIFIHPNPEEARALVSGLGRPATDAALAGRTGSFLTRDPSGEEVLLAYAPERTSGWGVLISQPTSVVFDLSRRQLFEQLGLLGAAVVLTGLLGWQLGGRLNRFYRRELAARAQAEAAAHELRVASAENEAQRRFLENLIASAPVAIAVLEGPDHRFATVNALFQARRPGVPMIGRPVAEVFPETLRQGSLERLDAVFATGRQVSAVDQPFEFDLGDGRTERRYLSTVISRYDGPDGRPAGLLLISLDTTDTVLTRREIDRQKDEFLSIASHELKTPISSLALAAQMIERLLSRGTPDPERLERLVVGMRVQVERASELIGELLDVSRLDFGEVQLRHEPIDLVRLARAAVERERDTLPDDRHEIVVEVPQSEGNVIRGDEMRLDQVLTNLLSNAVKYSPAGGPVQVRLAQQDGQVIISIADRGIGIPPDERDRLFSPSGRTDHARRSGIEGTGLGLYISRRVVEAHGGTIEIGDTPGGGATFTVRLPVAAG